MIIGFDGRYAEGDLVGVGKYIKNLLFGVAKQGVNCIVFYSRKAKYKIPGVTSVILNSKNRYQFEQILLPIALNKYKVDLYHATGNMGIPVFCPVPSVLTVHDIIPLEIKDYFSYSPAPVLSKLSYNFRLRTSLAKSIKIVTVSNFVRNELIKNFRIPPKKIRMIYSGAPTIESSGHPLQELIGKKYILNHGGIDIRKNLDRLIEAFALVYKKHTEINLVITGNNKMIRKELDKLVEKLSLGKSVIFTGYVDDRTLASIIKNALMICYPTLSEGFGFPILEGFGTRVPVIASNISSIPEVAGNAVLLINPEDVKDIAMAMDKVLTDESIRKTMVLRGEAQYNRFSWEKSINEYINLYNNI